jgi:hypothetical protein
LNTVKKWMVEKISSTFININESYRSCNLNYNWLKE